MIPLPNQRQKLVAKMKLSSKILKSKKGMESQNWVPSDLPFWIVFVIVLGFTAVFFVMIVNSSGTRSSTIKAGLESNFLADRLARSPMCFAASDKENILGPYIIDYTKLSDSQINTCLNGLGDNDLAFKVTLTSSSDKIPNIPLKANTQNWNANRPSEIAERSQPVVIYYSGKLYNGEMLVELQNYKE